MYVCIFVCVCICVYMYVRAGVRMFVCIIFMINIYELSAGSLTDDVSLSTQDGRT